MREADEPEGMGALRVAFARLAETARDLPRHRDAFLLMVAMLAYNDGINTIIRMATIYGAEIGLEGSKMIPAVLLVQFLGCNLTHFRTRLTAVFTRPDSASEVPA